MTLAKTARKPSLFDVVALLADRPSDKLERGQVGTVIDLPSKDAAFVEFADDNGAPYALIACSLSDLIVLRYSPKAVSA
jgi:Domain of unknown function (DUF4926)